MNYLGETLIFGVDGINKLSTSSVIISGMGGLGIEIARNIILMGVKHVMIHDTCNAEIRDLASNYFLTLKSIGKNRALESISPLSALNTSVTVQASTEELTDSFLSNYKFVIITDYHSESDINHITTFCHQNDIKLILTEACGIFAYLFNDFSQNFIIEKPNLEKPLQFFIRNVSNDTNGIVSVDNRLSDLEDGDYIIFDDLKGITELNGKMFKVKLIDQNHFSIGDTTNFGKYIHANATATKIHLPHTVNFVEFKEALKKRDKMSLRFDSYKQHHDSESQVILCFVSSHRCGEKAAFEELLKAAKEINSEYKIVDEINEEIIREFAREKGAVISPTCSVFGGIVALEIAKSITGVMTPINQFLAMEWTSSLPKDVTYELKNDRYDPYRIVFGSKQQEVMENLRYLLNGASSLVCEHVKNMALMGIATKGKGQILINDNETLKKYDISSCFLFKKEDVGKKKSELICQPIHEINSKINIKSNEDQNSFNDKYFSFNDSFYENFDGVCNATDDYKSRLVENKCFIYNKPFFYTQTTGVNGQLIPVIPHITDSFDVYKEPPQRGITMDVIYNFPYKFEHCLSFAKIYFFEEYFINQPQFILDVLNDSNYFEKLKKESEKFEKLLSLKIILNDEKCDNFIDCIKWSRNKFDKFFINNIRDVQNISVHKTYWCGRNLYPTPITFDPNNKYHAQFIISTTLIKARVFGIHPEKVDILKIAADIPTVEEESRKESVISVDVKQIDSLINEVTPIIQKLKDRHFYPEKFELENEENKQLDFFEAFSILRAKNYGIKYAFNRFEITQTIAKINPPIIPTASIISGLLMLEMYKIHCIDNNKKIDDFRASFINLATSTFNIFDPIPCRIFQCQQNLCKYTVWDHWIVEGDLTVEEFIMSMKNKYNIDIDMLSVDNYLLYNTFQDKERTKQILKTKLTEIAENASGIRFNEDQKYLAVSCVCWDDDDNDILTPQLILKFKK